MHCPVAAAGPFTGERCFGTVVELPVLLRGNIAQGLLSGFE
jgi:hypothetical protein